MKLLAISGSLRGKSSNTALLRAGARVAPPGVIVNLCRSLNHLPHFNPDLDRDPGPGAVVTFRAQVRAADALLICSPEYAHGVPGTLKNALDWLVGSGEVVNKPVALIQTSARARYVYDSLNETLKVMMAVIIPEASITLALANSRLNDEEIAADPVIASQLRASIEAMTEYVTARQRHSSQPSSS